MTALFEKACSAASAVASILNVFSYQVTVGNTKHMVRPMLHDRNSVPYGTNIFQNKQGLWLHWTEWVPQQQPAALRDGAIPEVRGALFISHGVAEHSGRYEHFAMAWASRGFRVFSLDHQGHGLSEDWAERSAFARFEDLVDDYIQFMHQRRAADPALAALPCYLYGHSMGSLVALRVAQREPSLLTGLMISGCPLSPAPELASPAVQKICLALSRYLAHFPIKRLELHDVCRYQPTLDSIDRDPLCNTGFIAARWGAEMLNAIEYTRRDLKRIVTPSVAVNGTVDKLTAIEGSRIFVREAMQSPGRRLYQFEGAYHDLLGDPECFDDVMAILFDFVHTTSKGALGVQADPKVLDARLERSCLPSATS